MKPELLTKAQDVAHYHVHSQLQLEWAQAALSHFHFEENARVLDLGCRDGKITAEIAKIIPQSAVVGLDPSQEMIRFANAHFSGEAYKNLKFEEGDVLKLPNSDEFDAVVSFGTLNWIRDQQAVLNNIYRSLKSGGKILLVLPGNSDRTLKSIGDQVRNREHWKKYFHGYVHHRWYLATGEYHELAKKAGFLEISVQEDDSTSIFANVEALIDWWTPVSTAVQFLPEEVRDPFIEEVLQLYLSYYPASPSGKITLHWPRIEILAVKGR